MRANSPLSLSGLGGTRTAAAQAAEGGAVGAAEGATGRFVLGEAAEIRKINIRPNAADPNWGLTPAHLDKHFFGSVKYSLSKIDPGGTSDQWMHNLTELYKSPVTGATKSGMFDIVKQFPRADGSGAYAMGIRITPPKPDGTYNRITILTRQ